MQKKSIFLALVLLVINCCSLLAQVKSVSNNEPRQYNGIYYSGIGNISYLGLLDSAYMMTRPNARIENLSMLYTPDWNGFVEGPTWKMWWIQNSFGPTYTLLPFMDKAYQTFIYNSQDMWFKMQGNGARKDNNGYVGPKGVLCDAATLTDVYYRQGDGDIDKHDWCFGFTTAGILLQSELMLIRRNKKEISYYLPLIEAAADFIDSRRDTVKNVFLVGTAGNLLAPSYAGSGKMLPDSSYEKAYLAEISVNYIAALTRLIELEKMIGRKKKLAEYTYKLELAKKGLSNFITPEGYFVRSIELNGTKHGVFGEKRYGYFETTPNSDAMSFRVADDEQSKKIYSKISSIPGLRPYKYIIPNYPSYDDMYEYRGLFRFGEWVNGGAWATVEARMQMGYYRVGAYTDASDAFQQMLRRAVNFRLDNNLRDFGNKPYQPNLPVNCVYDCWGVPGGFMRGLFEYVYAADGLTLYPHIPKDIEVLQQKFPIYFGDKKIFISVSGSGNVSAVKVNGKELKSFTPESVFLPMNARTGTVHVSIELGGNQGGTAILGTATVSPVNTFVATGDDYWEIDLLREKQDTAAKTADSVLIQVKKLDLFYTKLVNAGFQDTYEARHTGLIMEVIKTIYERRQLKQRGELQLLPLKSQIAADNMYVSTVVKLTTGLVNRLEQYRLSSNKKEQKMYWLWMGL